MRRLTRIAPALPVTAVKTYQVLAPPDRLVVAACEQVDCPAWRHGWDTAVDEATELGRAQAHLIRTQARRTYREMPRGGGLTVFRFEAGQRCFADHRTRQETYLVRDGDWRGNPRGTDPLVHPRPEDWVEDMQENLDRVQRRVERG